MRSGLVERAVRAAEREREARVFTLDRFVSRRGEACLRRGVYELTGISGAQQRVTWMMPAGVGQLARIELPGEGVSLVGLVERDGEGVTPRYWVDAEPGLRPVCQLSDFAALA
jgi:hypothetical protein